MNKKFAKNFVRVQVGVSNLQPVFSGLLNSRLPARQACKTRAPLLCVVTGCYQATPLLGLS